MEKTREVFYNEKNRLMFPKVTIENVLHIKNNKGKPFYQKICFRGSLTLLFFFSEDQIKLLKEAQPKQFFLDGFFKTPKDFDQLISIFAFSASRQGAFAIAHCLVTGRSEDTYNIMFDEYVTLLDYYQCREIFNSTIITTDFEVALLNSVSTKFPQSKQSGCFFPLCAMPDAKSKVLWIIRSVFPKKILSAIDTNKLFMLYRTLKNSTSVQSDQAKL